MSQTAERVRQVTPDEGRDLADTLRDQGFDRLAAWVDNEVDRMEDGR